MRDFSVISPAALPLFVTDNVELCGFAHLNCGQAGYHNSNNNGQTCVWASFLTVANTREQDISSFSHELGEWYDDPLFNVNTSQSPCGDLEVGDPLEGPPPIYIPFSSYGWHLQALAFMEYFGKPAGFSANNWLDNDHHETSVCQNGP